jgi:hypothetical protein
MLVGLEKAGVPVEEVFEQLRRRFGVSGLDEKASRTKAPNATPAGEDAASVAAGAGSSPKASPRQ